MAELQRLLLFTMSSSSSRTSNRNISGLGPVEVNSHRYILSKGHQNWTRNGRITEVTIIYYEQQQQQKPATEIFRGLAQLKLTAIDTSYPTGIKIEPEMAELQRLLLFTMSSSSSRTSNRNISGLGPVEVNSHRGIKIEPEMAELQRLLYLLWAAAAAEPATEIFRGLAQLKLTAIDTSYPTGIKIEPEMAELQRLLLFTMSSSSSRTSNRNISGLGPVEVNSHRYILSKGHQNWTRNGRITEV